MPDLLKTAAVLILIIVLLRRKVSMAAVMPIGALVLGIIYLTPPRDFLQATARAVFAPKSIEMTLTLLLTMVMEHILRTTGMLKRMVSSLSAAFPDRRVVMAAMPAMIGMLPSPGGAVFSAPMVQRGGRRSRDRAGAEGADQLLVSPHLGVHLAALSRHYSGGRYYRAFDPDPLCCQSPVCPFRRRLGCAVLLSRHRPPAIATLIYPSQP